MSAHLDSSVLIAALAPDEPKHAESPALLRQGGNAVYSHAILETFSTLTGGRLGAKVDADLAAKLLNETILPRVQVVELGIAELMAALQQARLHGVRGGAVYDFVTVQVGKPRTTPNTRKRLMDAPSPPSPGSRIPHISRFPPNHVNRYAERRTQKGTLKAVTGAGA